MHGLRVSEQCIRQYNVGILKKYNENLYRLIALKSLRIKGYEQQGDKGKKNTAKNSEKLPESISRTRSKIYELAMCNNWTHFITLTLSPEYHDRHDLDSFHRKLSKWLNNYNFRKGTNIKYLLIPEQHEDGAWHMHGFLMGLPYDHMKEFTLLDNIPAKMKAMIRAGRKLFNWPAYAINFGWVSMEQLQNRDNCAKYVSKYITKQQQTGSIAVNDHLYYCSKELNRADVIFQDTLRKDFVPDYSNDYVKVKDFSKCEDAAQYFCDGEEQEDIQWGANDQIEREAISIMNLVATGSLSSQ